MRRLLGRKNKLWILVIGILFLFYPMIQVNAGAEEEKIIPGVCVSMKKGDGFDITQKTDGKSIKNGSEYGKFRITGDITSIDNVNEFQAVKVNSGQITFIYSVEADLESAEMEQWHFSESGKDKVAGVELPEDVASGAILVQSSRDGENWVTDTDSIKCDVAKEENWDSVIYQSNDIQLLNGCYYRVLVAYEMEKGEERKYFLDKKYYRNFVEMYSFYAISSEVEAGNVIQISDEPRKQLGETVCTKQGGGYKEIIEMEEDNPHFGDRIGKFWINGYTAEVADPQEAEIPVFLKHVGNTVTLWFSLEQDINCLFGNEHLAIVPDDNGYDILHDVKKQNLGRGALIISQINYEDERMRPQIYTDFLAANASTRADTRLQLFEEGDYDVVLDYEVENDKGFNSYYNYKIPFKFKIRNDNCMVFPRDVVNGNELVNFSLTENGFKLDWAKSRYLDVIVTRSVLIDHERKKLEDRRFSRAASEDDKYCEEGIYTFTVSNKYTGEKTVKTILVGSDPFLKAMSKNGLTVEELNTKIGEGCVIEKDGTLTQTPSEDETQEVSIDEKKEVERPKVEKTDLQTTVREEKEESTNNAASVLAENETEIENNGMDWMKNQGTLLIVVGIACLVIIGIAIKGRKK